ncbi:MAG: glycoside hydrolase family 20 zincin-like fold domain-containing protein, partial [Victivallales bacterium]|nr:glycoside hydrolase family 20 zincin-like fold domain-containing protein [Victivallales bacterium]
MANKTVIPTPVKCNFTGKNIEFPGFRVEGASLAAPYALEMGQALLNDQGAELVFSKLEHDNPQAYKIAVKPDKVCIHGAGESAFIYAMSTLLQLAEISDEKIILPEGEIFDYPQFEQRGVNWLLMVEMRGWSQDAGDGQAAFISRFVSGLDTAAFFKLNAVFIDGFGWNPERFPGYGELMRKLNYKARRRGIKLIFSGCNAGYCAQWYDFDGPKFQNRKSYPDGELYSCLDSQMPADGAGVMGTCLSNKVLLKQKQKNLIAYVKTAEPGMLYVHGLDISTQAASQKSWNGRCPECRRRWPNDNINAADGLAGAIAELYDGLYEAVCSVRNPGTGYDAARDCTVNMVSPNYTEFSEDDDEWKYHLEYFKVLSGCLKNKEIHLMLREQFFNYTDGGPRLEQLRDTVGPEQKLSLIYFSSGSTFYNSLPVTADAALIRYFKGVNVVIAGSGNAFQEPRQIIFAEYMWNPTAAAFRVDFPKTSGHDEFPARYHELTDAKSRPEAVFADNGLLGIICKKLYGTEAGLLVAALQHPEIIPVYDPKRSYGHAEAAGCPAILTPPAPLTNEMFPGYHFSVFNKSGNKTVWRQDLPETAIEFAENYEIVMSHLARISNNAAFAYRQAASRCRSALPINPDSRKTHLERMAETCSTGARLAEFTRRWLHIFAGAYESLRNGMDKRELQTAIKTRTDELTVFAGPLRTIAAGTLDPNRGDTGQAVRTIEFLLRDLT